MLQQEQTSTSQLPTCTVQKTRLGGFGKERIKQNNTFLGA
jgi:hypothetical protein